MYPEPGTRTHAVWEYVKEYTLKNGGYPPTVRDFLRDKVDNITSTSIADYHLKKLEEIGLIYRHHGGLTRARNIEIIGALYVLPDNVRNNLNIQDFGSVVFPASVNQFLEWHSVLAGSLPGDQVNMIVATDDTNIQLIAIGLGYGGIISPTVFDEEEEENEEEDTRVPA